MKPLDLETLDLAVRTAVAARDWETLARLDTRLSTYLALLPAIDDGRAIERLRASYEEALVACEAARTELEQRLTALGRSKEGHLAYALASQWDEA